MQKRIVAAIIICILLATTTGCASHPHGGPAYMLGTARAFDETVDAFFKAVDERDEEAVWNLFSAYTREEVPDLKDAIERLFDFYPGPTQKCERDGSMAASSGSSDHGVRSAECSQWFAVICNDTTYYCDITLVCRNDKEENKIGIQSVSVVSEKVVCSEEFRFSNEPGLHVAEDASGDYETRRIGGYPKVYVSMDRKLTEQDVMDFLEKDTSFKRFREIYGEPNAETLTYTCWAYELEEEDGEKRYAVLSVYNQTGDEKASEAYEKGTITRAVIENDVDIAYLYVLWEME